METTLQEFINQMLMIIISGVLAVIAAYAKKFIQTKIDIAKYGFENEKLERIIDNAVNFAEQKGKQYVKVQAKKIAGSDKLDFARDYINKVDKNIVTKYGDKLDDMIERKVSQVIR